MLDAGKGIETHMCVGPNRVDMLIIAMIRDVRHERPMNADTAIGGGLCRISNSTTHAATTLCAAKSFSAAQSPRRLHNFHAPALSSNQQPSLFLSTSEYFYYSTFLRETFLTSFREYRKTMADDHNQSAGDANQNVPSGSDDFLEILSENFAALRFLMKPTQLDRLTTEERKQAFGILQTTSDSVWRFADNARINAEQTQPPAQVERAQVLQERESETQRARAEIERLGVETEKIKAEAGRARAEKERLGGEVERVGAETERIKADEALANAQTVRMRAELQKVDAEAVREKVRLEWEVERLKAETARLGAEVERVKVETARVKADEALANAHTERTRVELEKVNAETTREKERFQGEVERLKWEVERLKLEKERIGADTQLVKAHTERVRAEKS